MNASSMNPQLSALMLMPQVDMNSATRLGDIALLEFMLQWSKQPAGRPLNYDPQNVLTFALKCGSTDVLEWWLNRPTVLFVDWDWRDCFLMEAFCERKDHVWLEWWKARGYPYLELEEGDDPSTFALVAVNASHEGRVDLLDWLLENVGAVRIESASAKAVLAAARRGHVHVMDWWVTRLKAGVMGAKMDWIELFSTAFYHAQAAVLDWCKTQPNAMEALQHGIEQSVLEGEASASHCSEFRSMCYNAVCNGPSGDWLHAFGLLRFAQSNSVFSRKACEKGQLELVKELHSRGYLLGSRNQLVQSSLGSGKLELLKWIHATVDLSIPDMKGWYFGYDPYDISQGCGKVGVDILDWLLANGFPFPAPGDKRAKVFGSAAYYGRLDVLEWMFTNGFATDMTMEDWSGSFGSASEAGHVHVLDWLAERIPKIVSGTATTPSIRIVFWRVFSEGRVGVIEWWMQKAGWLKDVYDLHQGQPYLYACERSRGETSDSMLASLEAWYDAGEPVDLVKCIHNASVHGRIDILDWLLHSTRASEQDFAKAWSSNEFPDEATRGNMYAHYWYDIDNHGKSLLWWYANLPQVCTRMPVNRGPFVNPIQAHLFKHLLKNPSFELLDPGNVIDELVACVPILDYWRRHCKAEELEELTNESLPRCLEVASRCGKCDVLEWFKVASGLTIECPSSILNGDEKVPRCVKSWWAKSGLVDEKRLARIKVE
ncbi:hypothetical protein BCR44DRAFT_1443597 [Catenaria anguillulae PL171]|uniref:Ankyrin repeat-containing domain protein n=1 Tax=Catenaria anguillulae PL171 TaxID=765915 RepID=A0A1Y2H8Y3_9FUNG|nr:hypothetical protein BCR44DRAFT_1443597 [Catenaria anguillulae PL171]